MLTGFESLGRDGGFEDEQVTNEGCAVDRRHGVDRPGRQAFSDLVVGQSGSDEGEDLLFAGSEAGKRVEQAGWCDAGLRE